MNIFKVLITILALAVNFTSVLYAQSTSIDNFDVKIQEAAVPGAQLGSLVCEDANGSRVLCSGTIEETVLGIVTNVPYITLNKPIRPDASKYIFEAIVSVDNGVIHKGDFLKSGKNGTLVKAESADMVYAIALGAFDGAEGKILVKLASR